MSAEFLQTLAVAMPGAVVHIDGMLRADHLVLDRPITLVGGPGGGLRGRVSVRAEGVTFRNMTLQAPEGTAALEVDRGASVALDRCHIGGGWATVHGALTATNTTFATAGVGLDVHGTLALDACVLRDCSGTALAAAAGAQLALSGVEVTGCAAGLVLSGCTAITAAGCRIEGCGINLEVRDGSAVVLADMDLGAASEANVWVHGESSALTLERSSVHGDGQVAISVTDGATARLDACMVRGGQTTLRVSAATATVEGCSLGPASPNGVELRFEAGCAVKLSASRVETTGFAWTEGTVVCLDTSFDGTSTSLAIRAPGTLRADGSTFRTSRFSALRVDGCDAELERCHLFGDGGIELRDATLTLGRCEIDTTPTAVGIALEQSTLTATQCAVRGGPIVVTARASQLVLTEVKISGDDTTRTGLEADETTAVSLTRCQVDHVQETAVAATLLEADSTHVLGGAHWGVRVQGQTARTSMTRCLIQAPVGFAALSVDGQVQLLGCNLEGLVSLSLGPSCVGTATRCGVRGREIGVSAFNYGIRLTLDDCNITGATAVEYKRGYELILRGGTVEGTVLVEDRRLILDGIELDNLEIGPRGQVLPAVRPQPEVPQWAMGFEAAQSELDAEGDWHRYADLLEAALADPAVSVTGIPEGVATAPRHALERRRGETAWPTTWRILAARMRALDDWLDLVTVWVRGAFDQAIAWEVVALENKSLGRSPIDTIEGHWRAGEWALTGTALSNDQGNPRDGYAFDVCWTLRRGEDTIFVIAGCQQSPFPHQSFLVSAPDVPPEKCFAAAALVHVWNDTI